MHSVRADSRRSTHMPFTPATKGLKGMMEKLGSINKRHEELVRRVDELEVSLLLSAFGVFVYLVALWAGYVI